jgi:hypothetical protein
VRFAARSVETYVIAYAYDCAKNIRLNSRV